MSVLSILSLILLLVSQGNGYKYVKKYTGDETKTDPRKIIPLLRPFRKGESISFLGRAQVGAGMNIYFHNGNVVQMHFKAGPPSNTEDIEKVSAFFAAGNALRKGYWRTWLWDAGSQAPFEFNVTLVFGENHLVAYLHPENPNFPNPALKAVFYQLPIFRATHVHITSYGAAVDIDSVQIDGEDTPTVFLPRLATSAANTELKGTLPHIDHLIGECSVEAVKKQHKFMWFENGKDCSSAISPPSPSLPYFEQLPRNWIKCPCECWSNPDDFVVLNYNIPLEIKDPKKETTVIFEAWSASDAVVFERSDDDLSMAFYEQPEQTGNCAVIPEVPVIHTTSNAADHNPKALFKFVVTDKQFVRIQRRFAWHDRKKYYTVFPGKEGTQTGFETVKRFSEIAFAKLRGVKKITFSFTGFVEREAA